MKKYLFISILATAFLIGPTACSLFQSCPEVLPFFKIEGLELTHMSLDESNFSTPLAISSVNWNNYSLRTYFESTYHTMLSRQGGANLYALSCADDGYNGSQVGVDTLYLVALEDYSKDFVKNDTLNPIVMINDFMVGLKFYDLEEYLIDNRSGITNDYFELKLTEAPSEANHEMRFELIYQLETGEVFKQQSDKVIFSQ